MGLGAISGDITEINFDKENASRAVVMELEANNLEDSKGNPLSMKFMNNDGYTEDEDNTTKGGIRRTDCAGRVGRDHDWWSCRDVEGFGVTFACLYFYFYV